MRCLDAGERGQYQDGIPSEPLIHPARVCPLVAHKQLEEELGAIPGVVSVHDTHLWSPDGEHHILTLHLVLGESSDKDEFRRVTCEARERMTALGITHATIEIEEEGEGCKLAVEY